MRKLIFAVGLLGGSLLPMAPPAEAQRMVVVRPVRPHPARRGRWHYRGRWYNHRRFRNGRWFYW
jgi:hypothetical protein